MFDELHLQATPKLLLGAVGAQIVLLPLGDAQITISETSFRLQEIEQTINAHPAIAAGAIVLRDIAGSAALACYLVLAANRSLSRKEAQEFLSAQTREFALAWEIVFVQALPRLVNKMVDREALATRPRERQSYPLRYVAPRTEMEAQLASAAAEILQLDRLGIYDNFFTIGGVLPLAEQFMHVVKNLYPSEFQRAEGALITTSLFVAFCMRAQIADLVDILMAHKTQTFVTAQKPNVLRVFSLRKVQR